jgi:hypothetical protein
MLPRVFQSLLLGRGDGLSLRRRGFVSSSEPIVTVRPQGAMHPSECRFEVAGPSVDTPPAPVLTPLPDITAQQLAAELHALSKT